MLVKLTTGVNSTYLGNVQKLRHCSVLTIFTAYFRFQVLHQAAYLGAILPLTDAIKSQKASPLNLAPKTLVKLALGLHLTAVSQSITLIGLR